MAKLLTRWDILKNMTVEQAALWIAMINNYKSEAAVLDLLTKPMTEKDIAVFVEQARLDPTSPLRELFKKAMPDTAAEWERADRNRELLWNYRAKGIPWTYDEEGNVIKKEAKK